MGGRRMVENCVQRDSRTSIMVRLLRVSFLQDLRYRLHGDAAGDE